MTDEELHERRLSFYKLLGHCLVRQLKEKSGNKFKMAEIPSLVGKIATLIEDNRVLSDRVALRNACQEVGIKYTVGGIREYLGYPKVKHPRGYFVKGHCPRDMT